MHVTTGPEEGKFILEDTSGEALPPSLERAAARIPEDIFARADAHLLEQEVQSQLLREGRMPLSPRVLARLVAQLQPNTSSHALVHGTGTGYATALLSQLVREVDAVEGILALAPIAERTLGALGIANVRLHRGSMTACRERAPFDLILMTGVASAVPSALQGQLAVGGRLVGLITYRRRHPTIVRVTRTSEDKFLEERLGELRFRKRLGDLLVEAGAADRKQVESAAAAANEKSQLLGEALKKIAEVPEGEITRALARQRGMRYGTLDELASLVNLDLVRSIPRKFLEHHRVIPIRRRENILELATSDPEIVVEDLSKIIHPKTPEFLLVTPSDYQRLWDTIDLLSSGHPATPSAEDAGGSNDLSSPQSHHLERRFTNLFESMLLDAIGERASDIHLERYGDQVRVRIRVDGDLRDMPRYRMHPMDLSGVINVIKIRSNLDIAEHRLPQGGRVRVSAQGKNFDLRVQIQPSLHAEHAVIRVLPQDVKVLTIEDLGFEPDVAADYRRLLEQPNGLVLVVGPTGSGKTTTLYAGLQLLARDVTRKILTVEDPIEYAIDLVTQTTVRSDIGFSFADAMRSFVRQDPDVILVGEIRDHETALEAIRASQTGHLVLSTLHCNDSTDAVQRLIDLGMHPNSIASELLAVISQRLARRICEGCKREAAPDPALAASVFPTGVPNGFKCWQGAGCGRCSGHGSYGRIACIEFLKANAALRNAISLHPPVGELRRLALQARMVPLRDSALSLVRQGKITFGDIPAIVSWERLAPEMRETPATT